MSRPTGIARDTITVSTLSFDLTGTILRVLCVTGILLQLIVVVAMFNERHQFLDVFNYMNSQMPLNWSNFAVRRFAQEVFDHCQRSPEPAACTRQQWTPFMSIPGTYPIYGLGAAALSKLYGLVPFATALEITVALSTVLGVAIALALMITIGWGSGAVIGALFGITHLVMTYGFFAFEDEVPLNLPGPLAALRFSKLIYLFPVLAMIALIGHIIRRVRPSDRVMRGTALVLLAFGASLLGLRGTSLWGLPLEMLALAVVALAILSDQIESRPLVLTMACTVLLFLFCEAFFKNAPWVPRFQTQILMASVYVIAAWRSDQRYALWLPLGCIFHIPTAGLLGLLFLLSEAPIAIRDRRITNLVIGSTICIAIAFIQQAAGGLTGSRIVMDAFGGIAPDGWQKIASIALSSRVALGLALAAASFATGFFFLRSRSIAHSTDLARLFFLYAAYAPIPNIQRATSTIEPTLMVDPRFYQILNMQEYCGPGIQIAGTLLAILVLFFRRGTTERFRFDSGAVGSLPLATATLLALLSVKMAVLAPQPRSVSWAMAEIGDALRPLSGGSSRWMRYIDRIGGDNDIYVLDGTNFDYSAAVVISQMKMRLRISKGIIEPENIRFRIDDEGTLKP
jgi:hypothetical protein